MKKILALFLVVAAIALLAMPAAARGHHGGSAGSFAYSVQGTQSYAVCAVEDCALVGLHAHNNKNYTAHYYGDGHDYHGYCAVEGCALAGYHEHDGAYCFAHTQGDGHGHYAGNGRHCC